MAQSIGKNQVTRPRLTYLLKKCSTMKDLKQIHAQMITTGGGRSNFIAGKFIGFCAVPEHGNMDYALSIFDKIGKPDGFIWNTMIRGFCESHDEERAFEYHKAMQCDGISPDSFTFSFLLKACGRLRLVLLGKQFHCGALKHGLDSHVFVGNTLIHMYGMFQDIGTAQKLFEEMAQPGLVAWNTILDCHLQCQEYRQVLHVYMDALCRGMKPDEATLVVILSACSKLGAFSFGKWIHDSIRSTSLIDTVPVCNALIDMYAKCGAVQEALSAFDGMNTRNIVTWNTMILGLAEHGHADDALELFSRMLRDTSQEPDDVTFLGVLSACKNRGMVEEGKKYFQLMKDEYRVEPTVELYGCMVDMLGRAGLLEEAYLLIKGMSVKCNSVVWRTLLAACKVHRNVELGEKVLERLSALEPHHSGDYVLLSSLYASADRWDKVLDVRRSMQYKGVAKPEPGNSSVSFRD